MPNRELREEGKRECYWCAEPEFTFDLFEDDDA